MKKKDFILLFEGNSYVKDDYIDTCPLFFLSRVLVSQERTKKNLVESKKVFNKVFESKNKIIQLKDYQYFSFNISCNFWDDEDVLKKVLFWSSQGKKMSREEIIWATSERENNLIQVVEYEISRGRTVIVLAGKGHLPIDFSHHLYYFINKHKYALVYHN